MSVFLLPTSILKRIDRIRRNFFWQGIGSTTTPVPLIAWDNICKPKEVGGLGIKNLRSFNLALLAKWLYKWFDNVESPIKNLWLQLQHNKLTSIPVTTNLSSPLMQILPIFQITTHFNPTKAHSTLLWYHNWGHGILSQTLPQLFSLSLDDHIDLQTTLQLTQMGNLASHFSQISVGSEAQLQFQTLSEILRSAMRFLNTTQTLSYNQENYTSTLVGNNKSIAASLYNFMTILPKTTYPYCSLWKTCLPPKMKLFAWKILDNKLPTLDNLIRRGWILPNCCLLCMQDQESCQHLFNHCSFFQQIQQINLNNHNIAILSLKHTITAISDPEKYRSELNEIQFSIFVYFHIWKERCKRTFTDGKLNPTQRMDLVQLNFDTWKAAMILRTNSNRRS